MYIGGYAHCYDEIRGFVDDKFGGKRMREILKIFVLPDGERIVITKPEAEE